MQSHLRFSCGDASLIIASPKAEHFTSVAPIEHSIPFTAKFAASSQRQVAQHHFCWEYQRAEINIAYTYTFGGCTECGFSDASRLLKCRPKRR